MKKILVCGAGGFIGNHLVNRLKGEDSWVRGVDLKFPEFLEEPSTRYASLPAFRWFITSKSALIALRIFSRLSLGA